MKFIHQTIRSFIKLSSLLLLLVNGGVYAVETPVVTVSNGLTLTNLTGDAYNINGSQAGKLIFTFSNHSFYLTDFNELDSNGFGVGPGENIFGIPSTPSVGYDATINLIPGFGYMTTFDIKEGSDDSILVDNLRPEPEDTPCQPLVRIDYDSSNNKIKVSYDSDDAGCWGAFSINSSGEFSSTVTFTQSVEYTLISSDSTAPTMTITASGASSVADGSTSEDASLTMTFTSDEATTDFAVSDISVANATLSNFSATSSTVYTATLTPTAQGAVTVNVAASTFNDAAGNDNTAATEFNWTYLANPLNKQDVVGSVEAWTNTSSRWAKHSIDVIDSRINWLNRHKDTTKTSYQGVKIHFENEVIETVMNATPKSKDSIVAGIKDSFSASRAVALLQNTDGAMVASGDNIKSDAQDIALNEAARFRKDIIGTLNPTFGTVIDDWSMWTAGEITIGKTDATSSASKQELNGKAISLGFDRPVGDNDLVGFALSIGKDDTDVGTSTTKVKSDNYSLSNYNVLKQESGVTIETVLGLGHLKFDTTRKDGNDILTGSRDANQAFASVTIRDKTFERNNWSVSPYGKAMLARTNLDSFSETGGATALTFNKQTVNDAKVYVGADINYLVTINNGTIKPFAKLEYGLDVSDSSEAVMHYNTETTDYTLNLDNKSKSNWKLGLGVDLITKDSWDASIGYEREQVVNAGHSDSLTVDVSLKF
jgi:VCBS repeat-containing protein